MKIIKGNLIWTKGGKVKFVKNVKGKFPVLINKDNFVIEMHKPNEIFPPFK